MKPPEFIDQNLEICFDTTRGVRKSLAPLLDGEPFPKAQ